MSGELNRLDQLAQGLTREDLISELAQTKGVLISKLPQTKKELGQRQDWQDKAPEQIDKWQDRTWDVIKWVGGLSVGVSFGGAIAILGLAIRAAIK